MGKQTSLLNNPKILGERRTWCQKYTQTSTSKYSIKPASCGMYKCMCMRVRTHFPFTSYLEHFLGSITSITTMKLDRLVSADSSSLNKLKHCIIIISGYSHTATQTPTMVRKDKK